MHPSSVLERREIDTHCDDLPENRSLYADGYIDRVQFGSANLVFYVDPSAHDPNWIEQVVPPEARNS